MHMKNAAIGLAVAAMAMSGSEISVNAKNTIAKSKYQPHQGSKEVQRRLKQEARAAAKANA